MTETLKEIQKKVDSRLAELEPLVEEYRQLQVVAKSLREGGDPKDSGAGRSQGSRGSRPAGRPRAHAGQAGGRRRAPRGQNREAMLSLIGERPGIGNREIADLTGIGRRVVASAVSKYKRDGLLVAQGSGVKLADKAAV